METQGCCLLTFFTDQSSNVRSSLSILNCENMKSCSYDLHNHQADYTIYDYDSCRMRNVRCTQSYPYLSRRIRF